MKPYLSTRTLLILLSLIIGSMIAAPALAATLNGAYSLDWFTINNGGGSANGGSYPLNSSIGQSIAGSLSGGSYTLGVGYWSGLADETPVSSTLQLDWSASVPIAAPGQSITFTLTLTATGPAAIPAILTDTLPISMTYVNGSCPNYQNPTCNGRYVLGQNMWEWTDDTANVYSLSEFLQSATFAYPDAGQVVVSLVGHGSGWYPNVLLGLPSAWDGQPGGVHPGGYLTTRSLGNALRWAYQATGRKINLLYLDACLMAMSEVAYEVSDSVDLVLASENLSTLARFSLRSAASPIEPSLAACTCPSKITPSRANWCKLSVCPPFLPDTCRLGPDFALGDGS